MYEQNWDISKQEIGKNDNIETIFGQNSSNEVVIIQHENGDIKKSGQKNKLSHTHTDNRNIKHKKTIHDSIVYNTA